ncbi:MAG: nucleotidyl transferase AbiEii/AbiGii toxin family protein [Caldiserica bacterium]|nr:nucleotidyl transferase AbiEii/AbiGii toxin family protein [Caldisericota bacterium]
MYQIVRESQLNRRLLFDETAKEMGIPGSAVEKDFWVCFFLDLLFHRNQDAERFCFKGGTSLSKGYHAIQRFSEDIDLILDWRLLGYSIDEPCARRSNTQQMLFNNEINAKTEEYLARSLLPSLERLTEKYVAEPIGLYIDTVDRKTICIPYPHLFDDSNLVPVIRLEIGALAAWTPLENKTIEPYVAEHFPNKFLQTGTDIRTVQAKRTFWEKAVILHREAHRVNGKIPARYARHYYDVYMLSQTSTKDDAFADVELLKTVASFNRQFYYVAWARYEDATLEKISLIPSGAIVAQLAEDYLNMQDMLFGSKPSIDAIMKGLTRLESEIHLLGATATIGRE